VSRLSVRLPRYLTARGVESNAAELDKRQSLLAGMINSARHIEYIGVVSSHLELLGTSQQLRGLLFVSRLEAPANVRPCCRRRSKLQLHSWLAQLVTLRTSEILSKSIIDDIQRNCSQGHVCPSSPIHSLFDERSGAYTHTATAHISLSLPIKGSHPKTANMSLVNLAHVCSHLQNASKARLGLTSIPVSKMHVKLALGLQQEGFLSSVTLGGPTPPKPFLLQSQPDPEHLDKMARELQEEPWLAYPAEKKTEDGVQSITEKMLEREQVHGVKVPENPARRRLWLGLKYWQNEPVLKNMKLVSKPTRRIWLTSEDLGKITRTRESSYVKGLTHPGECMFVTTDRGILEARECVERRLGGMALCRVWG